MKKKIYFELLFLSILGALTSLSLPPYNFFIINFITFSYVFSFLYRKKKNNDFKKSFLYGWIFGLGYFLSSLYWISISLTFDENFKFLIPIALILIPAFLAIFYGLATYFFFIINVKKPTGNFFLFALLFGITEFIRGNILTGFPWNLIVYSLTNQIEILQVISLIGTYGLNILCISLFISPAIFILRESKTEMFVFIFFILSPIILYTVGSIKIKSFQKSDLSKNNYKIRVIGSTIGLERFYKNIDTLAVLNELIKISEPNLNEKTLFIWPEGIIPNIDQSELSEFQFLFKEKFNENHLLGIGINSSNIKENKKRFYNSFSLYDHKLSLVDFYNKVNLVPFGEFLPFENILSSIGLKSLTNNHQSFHNGKKRKIVSIDKNDITLKILPLICYEIIYSGKLFNNSDFDYIINISEDGWFGNSVGPHQHFAHSIFRAIESGKYLIRSANNGIAAIINPTGEVEKKIPMGNSGYIDFSEKRVSNSTLFTQHGNKMFLIIILLYIFLIFSFNRIS